MNVGRFVNRLRARPVEPERWSARVAPIEQAGDLVHIGVQETENARAAGSGEGGVSK
jgi:hypothetical protein